MAFWTGLAEALWDTWTPVLVIAFLVTRYLVQTAPRPIENYHLRAAGTLIVGHVLALTIGVAQNHSGYEGKIAEVTSFAFAALAVLGLGTTAVFRALLPRVGFNLPRILIDLLTAVGVIFVFIGIGRRAGFSLAGLITTSAVLTAVIGFSLQDTLGNMMGGLSVQLDKSISVGDWITVNGVHGRVTEMRWRYAAIETRNWDTVIVPNGVLVKSQVTIMGRRTGWPAMQRRPIEFFVDFRTAPTVVMSSVLTAFENEPVENMAREPVPQVLFMGVRDSFAVYHVRYWLANLDVDDPTDSAVRTRIWFALRRAGISMSIPASSVFLTHETPEREARKAEREHEQRLRAIKKVDLFAKVPPEQQRALADHLELAPFAKGEAVCREGDKDDGLFMLVEGEAVVRIGKEEEARDVAHLTAGQFFGEMSLMTGEARTASVIAAKDLVCYRVSKAAFQQVLTQIPTMADEIAEILAMRKSALSAARGDHHDADRSQRMETAKRDLASRIRGFFGLDAR